MTGRLAVVAGNPKPGSRTLDAAVLLGRALTAYDARPAEEPLVLDVVDLGPELMGWGAPHVTAAVGAVTSSAIVVMASPTFKATYSGLLKMFLDQFALESLKGVVAVPLMLGAGPAHAMAPEVFLKPVLVELGATCPTPGLFLRDTTYSTGPELQAFADRWAPAVRAASTLA